MDTALLHRTTPLTWLDGHIIAQLIGCRGRRQHHITQTRGPFVARFLTTALNILVLRIESV